MVGDLYDGKIAIFGHRTVGIWPVIGEMDGVKTGVIALCNLRKVPRPNERISLPSDDIRDYPIVLAIQDAESATLLIKILTKIKDALDE